MGIIMRKLLNSLFVLSPESYLSLKNDNVVIHAEDGNSKMIPLIGLESILCFSYKGASPELIGKCAQNGITITFLTPNGSMLASRCVSVICLRFRNLMNFSPNHAEMTNDKIKAKRALKEI